MKPERLFHNLPRLKRVDDERGFREVVDLNEPEGPLPRFVRSSVGGPSVGQTPTPPVVTSVWSASDAAANGMTLSNGGLTATTVNGSVWQSIRGSISKTAGKLYVEFLCNSLGTGSDPAYKVHGFASSSFVPTSYLGSTNYSAGIWSATLPLSSGFTGNYVSTLPATPSVNDVWALAIDFTAGSIWFGRNNVWSDGSNPATASLPIVSFTPATVGALFPAMSLYDTGGSWTLQPTAASQKYLPPPGFQAWDGGPVTPPASSVWSAADATTTGMTISNGGLTLTSYPIGGGWGTVRTTTSKATGKWYIEFLCVSPPSDNRIVIGLASVGFIVIGGYIGGGPYSGGTYPGVNFVSAGFTSNYVALNLPPNMNDVMSLAIDFDAGSMWFARNNIWVAPGNPATGVSPAISFVPATVGELFFGLSFYAADNIATLQPTTASQTYAPPAGFSAWDPVSAELLPVTR
jgi:hypothetical protein